MKAGGVGENLTYSGVATSGVYRGQWHDLDDPGKFACEWFLEKLRASPGSSFAIPVDVMSSAFRAAGFDDHANMLMDNADDILKMAKNNQAAELSQCIDRMGGFAQKVLKNWDPLTDISPHPTLMVLRDDAGNQIHAVGLLNKWIFDANKPEAMPLTRENLDKACQLHSEESTVKFMRPAESYRFTPGKKLKKLKRKACDISV